jgi:hypothetical protein
MNYYDILMCPIEKLLLNIERTRLIKKVKGNVLELGVGTGQFQR